MSRTKRSKATQRPQVFIGSSVEHLKLAKAVQRNLDYVVEATVWDQRVFRASSYPLDVLLEAVSNSDFGIFIFAPDDATIMRHKRKQVVRDNVVLELGLFIGRLGIKRTFLITPRGSELHLPTDLKGLTVATFEPKRGDHNQVAALGPACDEIADLIQQIGPKSRGRSDRAILEDVHSTLVIHNAVRDPTNRNRISLRNLEVQKLKPLAGHSKRTEKKSEKRIKKETKNIERPRGKR